MFINTLKITSYMMFCFFIFSNIVNAQTNSDTEMQNLRKYEEIAAQRLELTNNINTSHSTNLSINPDSFTELIKNSAEMQMSRNPLSESRNPQWAYSNVQLLNPDFELGHKYWTELYKSYDGTWTDRWDWIIESGSGGYGDWYAYMTDDDWLQSRAFRIPVNSQNLGISYAGKFVHWESDYAYCGSDGVLVALYDETTRTLIDSFKLHSVDLDPYDYEYYDYTGIINNISSKIGHKLSLHYLGNNNYPDCNFALYVDNIEMISEKTDQCANGKCRNHRMYSPARKSNHYTTSTNEVEKLISAGWVYEGLAYQVYESATGNTPVYRLYSPARRSNHFTTSTNERDKLTSAGWILEGVAYHVSNSSAGHDPVYRLYSAAQRRNHFTTSTSERDKLKNAGWILEGIAYYVPK